MKVLYSIFIQFGAHMKLVSLIKNVFELNR